MNLFINGKSFEVDIDAQETLLHVLRDRLGFMQDITECDSGECSGSCTVLINGKGNPACKVIVGTLNGDRIRTIEGIPEEHPVKKIWKEEGIETCPICKSGQIMKVISLLARMLNPAPIDIKEELNTPHCKCGENPKIIKAVNKASKYCYDS